MAEIKQVRRESEGNTHFQVLRLLHECLPSHRSFIGGLMQNTGNSMQVFACLEDGVVVGGLVGGDYGNGVAYANATAVNPDYRRKGLAGELLSHFEDLSKKAGYSLVQMDTIDRKVANWCIKRGYHIIYEGEGNIALSKHL